MRVKPEDLRVANKVANIKESSAGAGARKNYWNGVHRFVTQGSKWIMKTTDNTVWVEWHVPTDGPVQEMDVIVQEGPFACVAKYLEGGSLEVTRENRIVTLSKGQLKYRLREETPQEYPEPNLGENPTIWVCETRPLVDALRFLASFIDERNPNANKSVATLYTNGVITGGNPQRIATHKGLSCSAEMSFKSRTARVVAEFLSNIGEKVQISVTNATYKFTDPDSGHNLVVLAEEGRFKHVERDLTPLIREMAQVDRKMLLQLAKAFEGAMATGQNRVSLTFRGATDHASLKICTPGDNPGEVTEDEFAVFREVPKKPGETDPDHETRQSALGQLEIALTREFLADALEAMTGTNVKFKFCGRMVLVEDEQVDTEAAPAEGVNTPAVTRPYYEKSVLLASRSGRAGRDEEATEAGEGAEPVETAAPVASAPTAPTLAPVAVAPARARAAR